jgi:hypothetical protein
MNTKKQIIAAQRIIRRAAKQWLGSSNYINGAFVVDGIQYITDLQVVFALTDHIEGLPTCDTFICKSIATKFAVEYEKCHAYNTYTSGEELLYLLANNEIERRGLRVIKLPLRDDKVYAYIQSRFIKDVIDILQIKRRDYVSVMFSQHDYNGHYISGLIMYKDHRNKALILPVR